MDCFKIFGQNRMQTLKVTWDEAWLVGALALVSACALTLVLAFNGLCFGACAGFNAMEQRA
jgi:hypothetical protein